MYDPRRGQDGEQALTSDENLGLVWSLQCSHRPVVRVVTRLSVYTGPVFGYFSVFDTHLRQLAREEWKIFFEQTVTHCPLNASGSGRPLHVYAGSGSVNATLAPTQGNRHLNVSVPLAHLNASL